MSVSNTFLKKSLYLYLLLIFNYCSWFIYPPGVFFGSFILVTYTLILFSQIYSLKNIWPIYIFLIFSTGVIFLSGADGWDARSIWLFHAKRLFYEQNIFATFDGYVPTQHPDYPTMVPAFSATLANIVGAWNEVYPKFSSLFFIAPPLLVSVAILGYTTGTMLLLIAIGFYGFPHLLDGYIDAILAIYINTYILQLLYFSRLLSKDRLAKFTYIQFGSLIAIIGLLKNEGLIAAIFLVIVSAISIKNVNSKIKILYAQLVALAFCIFSWKIPVFLAGLPSEFLSGDLALRILSRIHSVESWQKIFLHIFENCWISLLLICLFFILKRAKAWEYKPPILFCFLYLMFLVFVYLITPLDLDFHLITSIDRILIPINLVLVSTIIFWIRSDYLNLSNNLNWQIYNWSPIYRLGTLFLWVAINILLVYIFLKSPTELDKKIVFAKNGSGTLHLIHVADSPIKGWHHPESWGVWLNGREGSIRIPPPTFPTPNFLKLELRPFLSGNIKSQSVTIEVGMERQNFSIDSSVQSVFLPLDIRFPWRDDLVILFRANSPISPKELGVGDDIRPLSIGLISATFVEAR